jgi:hypothetical protein
MGYITLKGFFKSGQKFLRLARSNKQSLQLYNINIDLMSVEEAKGVCTDRSKWKEMISAYLNGKWA